MTHDIKISLFRTSCNTSDQDNLFNVAINSCPQTKPFMEKSKSIYGVDLVVSDDKQNIFFCYTRPEYFDSWDAESYFKSLLSCLQQHNVSQLFVPDLKNDRTCKLLPNEQQRITSYLAEIYNCQIIICENKVKYPQPSEIPSILKTYHDEPISGHRGITETTRKIREEYFWKGMTNDIKNYVDSCLVCQRNKIHRKTFQAPMVITS